MTPQADAPGILTVDAASPALDTTEPKVSLGGLALVCPRDHGALAEHGGALACVECGASYPIVHGVPVLINDAASVFSVADYLGQGAYGGASYGRAADGAGGASRLYRRLARRLGDAPSSIDHFGAADALRHVTRLLPRPPRVLVVGAGGLDYGGGAVHTDVAFAPGVAAIADCHDLPFADGSYDLVIAVAVLEHVADPQRCAAEIWRVLDTGGHVYAVTPFLQPVHMGAHDFTRFTPLGHRRLFRMFDQIEAGVAVGVGSVAAWTLGAVLQSVSGRRGWRVLAKALALLCTPPLRRLDRWLGAPAHADAAGGCYFFGHRRRVPVPDREIIRAYRGGFDAG